MAGCIYWSVIISVNFPSVEGTPDEIMSDNDPPFNGKEFSSFLTGLGIGHTIPSPNYPE